MDVVIAGPVAFRPHQLKACEQDVGHLHNKDHTTLFGPGRWKVIFKDPILENGQSVLDKNGNPKSVEKESIEYREGETVVIVASRFHTIIFLGRDEWVKKEDGTFEQLTESWYDCIFAHRDFGGVVVERYNARTCSPLAYV